MTNIVLKSLLGLGRSTESRAPNCVLRIWSVRSKPVGRKCKNDEAKIFCWKAENRTAENTIRPKLMYIPYWRFIIFWLWYCFDSLFKLYKYIEKAVKINFENEGNIPLCNKLSKQGLLNNKFRPYCHFGLLVFDLLVIFQPYGKHIILAYWFRSYSPTRTC